MVLFGSCDIRRSSREMKLTKNFLSRDLCNSLWRHVHALARIMHLHVGCFPSLLGYVNVGCRSLLPRQLLVVPLLPRLRWPNFLGLGLPFPRYPLLARGMVVGQHSPSFQEPKPFPCVHDWSTNRRCNHGRLQASGTLEKEQQQHKLTTIQRFLLLL